jgi:hypothetical protein
MLPPVIKILSRQLIRSAQEGAADAPGHDMKTAGFTGRGDL